MTTFQLLVDALARALTHLIPVTPMLPESLFNTQLGWSIPEGEMELLVLFTASVTFLVYFRYDWLGVVSAALTSLIHPMSLKPERRSLDQHNLLFFLIVFLPLLAVRMTLGSVIWPDESIHHLGIAGILTFVIGVFFHLSSRWNRRIFGLNHLKLPHAALLAVLALFSLHPALPLVGILWIGFAFRNYHYESVFKYSMLINGLALFSATAIQFSRFSLREAFDQIGHLNSIAVLVVGVTVFWIGLENLQKTLQESTYRAFLWIHVAVGIYFFVSFFMARA
jgi:undecaprenyl pyrophosphate phosphatase UppP